MLIDWRREWLSLRTADIAQNDIHKNDRDTVWTRSSLRKPFVIQFQRELVVATRVLAIASITFIRLFIPFSSFSLFLYANTQSHVLSSSHFYDQFLQKNVSIRCPFGRGAPNLPRYSRSCRFFPSSIAHWEIFARYAHTFSFLPVNIVLPTVCNYKVLRSEYPHDCLPLDFCARSPIHLLPILPSLIPRFQLDLFALQKTFRRIVRIRWRNQRIFLEVNHSRTVDPFKHLAKRVSRSRNTHDGFA